MKSIYSIINKKLLFPAGELLYKSNILAEYKRLLKTDWYTRDQLENIQNYYLHSLVAHCYANVPYYRNLFDKLNIKPEEIRSKSDLVRLPILTKQIIRDNYQMLLSQDIKSRNIRKHSTGGSTGVPLQYITDTQGWSMAWASTFRAWDWYGFYVGEKIFTLGGHSLVSQKKVLRRKDIFERLLMRNYKYTSSEMKSEDFFRLYQNYMRLKPAAIRGYASSLFVFSKFIEENNLKIYPVRLILTTGESLMPMYRAKVQEIFRAPIYDNYGAGDGGISSHECYMHEGLHITEERSIIEIVDSNGLPLNNGEVGHVVSTDLHNYAFPFLRYLVGDMASIKKEFCSCGRKSLLLGEILGRNGKLLYSKAGVPISPTMLPVLLYRDLDYNKYENQLLYNKIDRFQIQQDINGDLKILLKMKSKDEESLGLFSYIVKNYERVFIGSSICLEFVDRIASLPSGKEDFVISHYQKKRTEDERTI